MEDSASSIFRILTNKLNETLRLYYKTKFLKFFLQRKPNIHTQTREVHIRIQYLIVKHVISWSNIKKILEFSSPGKEKITLNMSRLLNLGNFPLLPHPLSLNQINKASIQISISISDYSLQI